MLIFRTFNSLWRFKSFFLFNYENSIELIKINRKANILLLIAVRIVWLSSQLLAPDLLNFDVFSALFSPQGENV